MEQRLLEGHVGNHVAAALPGRHLLQDRLLAVNHADAGRPEDLVAGEHEKVRVQRLHVHPQVRYRLGAIDQHLGADVALGHGMVQFDVLGRKALEGIGQFPR
ncbi:hypothetical protein SDC9_201978 [bioreactor metagenome]|uniref:Uncharacterized protein n=1 Tax=bioreactor metagenome TaxID=1076179 RepID=A0A645ISE6_9ZZZZ